MSIAHKKVIQVIQSEINILEQGVEKNKNDIASGGGGGGGDKVHTDNDGNLGINGSSTPNSYINSGSTSNTTIGSGTGTNLGGSSELNTIVGYNAGLALTGASEHNVIIGAEAAETLQSAVSNVIIGSDTLSAQGGSGQDHENNVIIGNSALLDTSLGAAENQIVIGQGTTSKGNNTAVIGNTACENVYMGQNGEATLHYKNVHRKKHTHGKSGGTDYGGYQESILVTDQTHVSTSSQGGATVFVSTAEIIVLRIDMTGGMDDQNYYIEVESDLITENSHAHIKMIHDSDSGSGASASDRAKFNVLNPTRSTQIGLHINEYSATTNRMEVQFGMYTGTGRQVAAVTAPDNNIILIRIEIHIDEEI